MLSRRGDRGKGGYRTFEAELGISKHVFMHTDAQPERASYPYSVSLSPRFENMLSYLPSGLAWLPLGVSPDCNYQNQAFMTKGAPSF